MDDKTWPLVKKLCQFESEQIYISFLCQNLQRHISKVKNILLTLEREEPTSDTRWLVKILRRTSRSLKSFSEETGVGSIYNPPSKSTEVSGREKAVSRPGHSITHES